MTGAVGGSAGTRTPRVAIFIPTFGDGGVERMLVNLARGFAGRGVAVDFLVKESRAPYLGSLPAAVRIRALQPGRPAVLRRQLVAYLRAERPDVLMSAKGADDRVAIAAKRQAAVPTRFFLRTGTNLSGRLRGRGAGSFRQWWRRRAVRKLYREADGVVCVSEGVADDLATVAGIPRERLSVIRNPVVVPELDELAGAPLGHPWFAGDGPPVILGVGGLRTQKNFSLLIRAFARLRASRPARLVILGDGRLRGELEALSRRLGVDQDVDLPGFAENPYPFMRRAALFVLSSLWEGSPNVLVEALAVGTPVVSTDCPSGPREILAGGRLGPIVPIADEGALATAMARTLDAPPAAQTLREGVAPYRLDRSAGAYLEALGIPQPGGVGSG